jgi:hypothetical protein
MLRGEEDEAKYFLDILTSQQIAMDKKLARMTISLDKSGPVEEIKILA